MSIRVTISDEDVDFLRTFRKGDGFECTCPPDDEHEVLASDYQRLAKILESILGQGGAL